MGDNQIVVTVTAGDDATTQTYTITLTKAVGGLLVSNYLDNGLGSAVYGDQTTPPNRRHWQTEGKS